MAGCSRRAGKGRRKAVRSRPCSQTSSWMNWIASSIVAASDSCGTRMTVISMSAAKRPVAGHGKPDPLHRRTSQTADQYGEECHRPTVAPVVPRLHVKDEDPLFRRCIADKAVARFKDRVRKLTRRHRGISLEKIIADLNPFVRGWAGYFGFSQWRELPSLDGWIRRRLR